MWHVEEDAPVFYVANEDHVHPICFASKREAERACDRLNDRDAAQFQNSEL